MGSDQSGGVIPVEKYRRTSYRPDCERILPEQRVQVKPTRFRIPDLCIIPPETLQQQIVTTPPQLCIEILSPEDTLSKTLVRIKDYFNMGVPTCRIIDPARCDGWVATPGLLEDAIDGVLRAGEIEMPLAAVL